MSKQLTNSWLASVLAHDSALQATPNRIRFFVLCFLISFQQSAALSRPCSQHTIHHLEVESRHIRNWSRLRDFYLRYSRCQVDDAEVRTGVDDFVSRTLVTHWDTLRYASSLFKQDSSFRAFALAALNITDSTDDLNRIDRLAAERCPKDLHVLCRDIRQSIHNNN